MSNRFPGRGGTSYQYSPLRKPGEKKETTIQDGGLSNLGNKTHELKCLQHSCAHILRFPLPQNRLVFSKIIYISMLIITVLICTEILGLELYFNREK